MSILADSGFVASKDLRIEARSRVTVAQVLPFGVMVLLLFAFALDPDRGRLALVAPGLFWVAVMLAALLAIGRSFAIEQTNGARDGLRLSGIDGAAVFLGKTAAIAVQLVVLEILLGLGVAVLYGIKVTSVGVLVAAGLAATAGLSATGTLFGVLAAGVRRRETLLPLLLLPVITPVMLGATRAFESGLGGNPAEGWPWVALLVAFAGLYLAVGVLAFGSLWEDA